MTDLLHVLRRRLAGTHHRIEHYLDARSGRGADPGFGDDRLNHGMQHERGNAGLHSDTRVRHRRHAEIE